jgi:hypothetical protein
MAMKNIILAISVLALSMCNNICFAKLNDTETLKIKTLENDELMLTIHFDNVHDKITLELNSEDNLVIYGYRGLINPITILCEKFIEITYRIRGGTGVSVERYILVCISENKLYKAIDVTSKVYSEFKEIYVPSIDSLNLYDESELYKLSFKLFNDGDRMFRILALKTETVKSKIDPSKNYSSDSLLTLNFDFRNKIFYNKKVSLNGTFTLINDNCDTLEKKIEIRKDFKRK